MDEPADPAAVQADDALIDALGAGLYIIVPSPDIEAGYGPDDRVIAMLDAWKNDVDSEPVPPCSDTPAAAVSNSAASPPALRRPRRLVPLATAATLIVLILMGISVGAREARPGDPLWGMSEVLYSKHAHSVGVAIEVNARLATVRTALASGQTEMASQELTAVAPLLAAVAPEDGGSQLAQQQQFLRAKVAETPPHTRADPDAPLGDGQAAPAPSARLGSSIPPEFRTAPPARDAPRTAPSPSTAPSADPRIHIDPVTPTTTATAPTPTSDPTSMIEGSPDPPTPSTYSTESTPTAITKPAGSRGTKTVSPTATPTE